MAVDNASIRAGDSHPVAIGSSRTASPIGARSEVYPAQPAAVAD